MKTQTTLVTTAVLSGLAVGYLLARGLQEKNQSPFRYTDEDALRRAQARGAARDYREMERRYGLRIQ